ncbi:MAG: hypothetical protein KDA05_11585, partial [Phycisphaerales bacterium]|nr:hypothetical protein [Phycisphaerales bacterium]
EGGRLVCPASASAEPADYRVAVDGSGHPWVELVTANRWLSESIESDLVEHSDDLGELIEDELIELGFESDGMPPTFQHFRSADLLYTFRTMLPDEVSGIQGEGSEAERAAEVAAIWMRAYEQAFRRLGDMDEGGEE